MIKRNTLNQKLLWIIYSTNVLKTPDSFNEWTTSIITARLFWTIIGEPKYYFHHFWITIEIKFDYYLHSSHTCTDIKKAFIIFFSLWYYLNFVLLNGMQCDVQRNNSTGCNNNCMPVCVAEILTVDQLSVHFCLRPTVKTHATLNSIIWTA